MTVGELMTILAQMPATMPIYLEEDSILFPLETATFEKAKTLLKALPSEASEYPDRIELKG